MITSFESLAERRLITLNYHKKDSQQYINSLNYFEYARIYFEKNGFPEDNRRVYQSGKRKGQKVGWSDKEEKQQKEEARFLRSLLELDGTTRINAELAESLIESMYLYGDNRLEINFGFKGAVEHE